jgi:hypothetical protein
MNQNEIARLAETIISQRYPKIAGYEAEAINIMMLVYDTIELLISKKITDQKTQRQILMDAVTKVVNSSVHSDREKALFLGLFDMSIRVVTSDAVEKRCLRFCS